MGFGGISIWQLLIIFVIVFLIFGTKRLKNLGKDLGTGLKQFRDGLDESELKQSNKSGEKSSDENQTKQS